MIKLPRVYPQVEVIRNTSGTCFKCGGVCEEATGVKNATGLYKFCPRCVDRFSGDDWNQRSSERGTPGWTFGAELECYPKDWCSVAIRTLSPEWGKVYDGSVSNGWEFVSPIMPERKAVRLVTAATSILNGHAEVNTSCGLHIHLSRDTGFSWYEQWAIYKYCHTHQNFLMSLVPKSRRDNDYCMAIPPLPRTIWGRGATRKTVPDRNEWLRFLYGTQPGAYQKQVTTVTRRGRVISRSSDVRFDYEAKSKKPLIPKQDASRKYTPERARDGHIDRRWWLNLYSLYVHGTIEVRLHSGTVNAEKILNWLILCKAMFQAAMEQATASPLEILDRTQPETARFYRARMEKFSDSYSTDNEMAVA